MEQDALSYDSCGRLEYNKEFHFNHGKPWTVEDLVYLCKYIEHDGLYSISLGLGRTATTVATKLTKLHKTKDYQRYKNLQHYWS